MVLQYLRKLEGLTYGDCRLANPLKRLKILSDYLNLEAEWKNSLLKVANLSMEK